VTLLAITRGDVADYVGTLVLVYLILIVIRVVMSFFERIPYYVWLDKFMTFVRDVTDPYLNVFRRFLPPIRLGPGALDLSPMIGMIVLIVVGGLVESLIRGA
jgi:YggT family protein